MKNKDQTLTGNTVKLGLGTFGSKVPRFSRCSSQAGWLPAQAVYLTLLLNGKTLRQAFKKHFGTC